MDPTRVLTRFGCLSLETKSKKGTTMHTVDSPPARTPTRPSSGRDPNSHRRQPRSAKELYAGLQKELHRLRRRVLELEDELSGHDLEDLERTLSETSDRAWTAVNRATIVRNDLHNTIEKLDRVKVRLRGVC